MFKFGENWIGLKLLYLCWGVLCYYFVYEIRIHLSKTFYFILVNIFLVIKCVPIFKKVLILVI